MVTHPKGPLSTLDANAVVEDIQIVTAGKTTVEGEARLPKVCILML